MCARVCVSERICRAPFFLFSDRSTHSPSLRLGNGFDTRPFFSRTFFSHSEMFFSQCAHTSRICHNSHTAHVFPSKSAYRMFFPSSHALSFFWICAGSPVLFFFFWSDFFFRWCFALTHPFPPHATRPILPISQPCLRIRTNASSRSSARRITTSGALVGCYARSAGQTSQKTEKKNCLFLNVAPPHLPYVRNSIQKIPPESLSHILSHT